MTLRIKLIRYLLNLNERLFFYPKLAAYYKKELDKTDPTIDHSTDSTEAVLKQLTGKIPTLCVYENEWFAGFGYAVRYGLEKFSGDCVAIMMADLSDDPADLVSFYREMMATNVDCVFGSRF